MFTVSSGFTSEQILDALERCSKNSSITCEDCPYRGVCSATEATAITEDAAELIRMLIEKIGEDENENTEDR